MGGMRGARVGESVVAPIIPSFRAPSTFRARACRLSVPGAAVMVARNSRQISKQTSKPIDTRAVPLYNLNIRDYKRRGLRS